MTGDRARKRKIRNLTIVTNEPSTTATRAMRDDNAGQGRAAHHRRTIAARCQVTGEPRSLVTRLVSEHGVNGLDDCTDAQCRFRAQLALFLLNEPTEIWDILTGPVAAQRVWRAWSVLDRFLPYPDDLVIISSDPDALRQALIGPASQPGCGLPGMPGMPGLRHDPATPPSSPTFIHIPTGATLHVRGPAMPPFIPAVRHRVEQPECGSLETPDNHRLPALTSHERRLLDNLPPITAEAEQLLAALLIRLPLADPHGEWTVANRHLRQTEGSPASALISPPEIGCQLLWGRDTEWRFEWQGPARARDIATALIDPLLGLAGTTAVLSKGRVLFPDDAWYSQLIRPEASIPWLPLIVRYGTAMLTLHGNL